MSVPSLRARLAAGELVLAPGVFDGLSARIARRAGFTALYASGGAIARSIGYPDVGLVTATEMLRRIEEIVEAAGGLPVVADADTGYGGVLNVVRTVRALERAGVAALHIEDQETPKRCGHYADSRVVPVPEMVAKVKAALDARRDPKLLVIARTDSRGRLGFDEALARARAYKAAGADVIFAEALASRDELARLAREVEGPLMVNLVPGGRTPLLPLEELRAMGYRLVICASDLQRAAMHAMVRAAQAIREHGYAAGVEAASFAERDLLVDKPDWDELERRFS
ncbi:MAG TPA: isocitrate lyase/PEP mutase family protein [Thermodesulfobacteriota bacterium]|nr:isocitrate lyase/PEP mutase family protein [Thermodesulfobacteriota bacterium]